MNNELKKLSKTLKMLGKKAELNSLLALYKSAQIGGEAAEWQAVLDEVNAPPPKQIFGAAAELITKGMSGLVESAKRLQGASPEDMKKALEIGQKIPGAIKGASIQFDVIKKFSERFNSMEKTAQLSLLKGMGTGALRIMPFVGPIFSGLFALKNLYYGFVEFKKLWEQTQPKVGLAWYEVLFPEKIMEKIQEFSDNPKKLLDLTQITKSAKLFVDEAISAVANSIDFVKDLIFFFLEGAGGLISSVIPPGWAAALGVGALDVGLSLIIMIIEHYTEAAALKQYDVAIAEIGKIAQEKINALMTLPDLTQQDVPEEELYRFFDQP